MILLLIKEQMEQNSGGGGGGGGALFRGGATVLGSGVLGGGGGGASTFDASAPGIVHASANVLIPGALSGAASRCGGAFASGVAISCYMAFIHTGAIVLGVIHVLGYPNSFGGPY